MNINNSKRKTWSKQDVSYLKILSKEKIPIKFISQFFGVTPNSISKAMQRYCEGYANQTYKDSIKTSKVEKHQTILSKWILKHKKLILKIDSMKTTIHHKTFLINEILYKNNLEILSPKTIKEYFLVLKNNKIN